LKKSLIPLILIALIFPLLVYFQFSPKKVCFENTCITADVARTGASRSRGLGFRDSLAQNRGMLFIWDKEASYGIWMKNMRFPIDIIWLDKDKKIVDIKRDAQPCVTACKISRPSGLAQYVIEVNSGFCEAHQVAPGGEIKF
jgi:hypothetical protein